MAGTSGGAQDVTVKDIYSLYSLQYPSEIQKIFEARLAKIENLDIEMDEVIRKTERTEMPNMRPLNCVSHIKVKKLCFIMH